MAHNKKGKQPLEAMAVTILAITRWAAPSNPESASVVFDMRAEIAERIGMATLR
jgi:hypothetical protein